MFSKRSRSQSQITYSVFSGTIPQFTEANGTATTSSRVWPMRALPFRKLLKPTLDFCHFSNDGGISPKRLSYGRNCLCCAKYNTIVTCSITQVSAKSKCHLCNGDISVDKKVTRNDVLFAAMNSTHIKRDMRFRG